MYINFWYPIIRSADLPPGKAETVRILGVQLVAWRDSGGTAHVQSDTCVHRGGSLGQGIVRDDHVACPYHGWRFGADGRCILIPSLGADAKIPARAKVDSYPVEERYGIVFAFLGDLPAEERPPLFEIEEYGKPGWRHSGPVVLELDAWYERSMENGLDPAHNEFVHPAQGNPGMEPDFLRRGLKLESWPWGSYFWVSFEEKGAHRTDLASLRSSRQGVKAGSGHHGPNTLATWIRFSEANVFHQYFFEAPVDGSHTRIFFINTRNCMLEEQYDARVEEGNLRVAHEDIAVLVRLNPVRTPENNVKEILVPSDHCILRYREWLGEWESRGWRVDLAKLRDTAGDVAYAIPCPARRTSGNWVLDAIPLMPPAEGERLADPQTTQAIA